MKSLILSIVALTFTAVSCTQSETKIETAENPDGSLTTTTIETEKSLYPDSAKINATVDKAKAKLEIVGEKLDVAAEKTGEKLQQAGENVKDAANRGADKVEVEVETIRTNSKEEQKK
ncbi:hypothetical protein [Chryseobacterium sp. MP_3.2]|uniref:hypothetical protein n=1 Tax=Chryseobacterium sp. MP_3.2 TaxID=3071712 RepID=UPI002E03F87E|nr:hypothetical protein [Chryseobacterium sp. MP_3.2]